MWERACPRCAARAALDLKGAREACDKRFTRAALDLKGAREACDKRFTRAALDLKGATKACDKRFARHSTASHQPSHPHHHRMQPIAARGRQLPLQAQFAKPSTHIQLGQRFAT